MRLDRQCGIDCRRLEEAAGAGSAQPALASPLLRDENSVRTPAYVFSAYFSATTSISKSSIVKE